MSDKARKAGYAPVGGLELYYEIHGSGRPLVVLHGGLGTIDWPIGPLLPALARTRQVVAVELQGHGRTADIDRPLEYTAMADDIGGLIRHLGLGPADLFGFSLGGGVALQTAIRHPETVRRLVVVSAPFRSDAWYPEVRAGMASIDAEAMTGSPPHLAYAAVAPRPQDWPRLIAKVKHLLTEQPYDWSPQIAAITSPTLIVAGDADSFGPAHAAEMFGLLGGGKSDGAMTGLSKHRLAILPGATHLDILDRLDQRLAIIPGFLDAE